MLVENHYMENMKKYKIIISGGGTGGHIFPAIAIAKELRRYIQILIFFLLVLKIEWKWKKYLSKDIIL